MSTFTKKYYHPKRADEFLTLIWETGYKNVQITYNGRLIKEVSNPGVFVNGLKITDEEIGKISIAFTSVGPKKLEVKVNRKKYKTVNKLNLGYDYSGLIAVFAVLAFFAAIEEVILGFTFNFNFQIPLFAVTFLLYLIPLTIYTVTSFLLGKRKAWAYFLGASMFALMTLFVILGVSAQATNFFGWIIILIRVAILVFVLLQFKHILNETKTSRPKKEDDLIDAVA